MADFKLGRFKYTWQGTWTAAERYNPDDIVSFGSKVYVCLVSHSANPDFYADLNFYNNDIPPLLSPRWELMNDGTSWLGNWQSDTYYKVGDIVKQSGTVYLCVEAHTSFSKYLPGTVDINPLDPTGERGFNSNDIGLENYWTVQITSQNWRINWTPDTYYQVNDIVRNNGRTYRCNTSHLSASSVNTGLEANLSDWDIVNIADDWKGDWAVSTKYIVNDTVKYGGIVYRCTVPHVSNSSEGLGLGADLGKWTIVHSSTEYKGTWTEGVLYKINDVVKYGSYTWICSGFHLSSGSLETQYFSIFCPGQEYDADWLSTVVYQQGDVVSYGGDVYYALSANTNTYPGQASGTWQLLFQNSRVRNDWDAQSAYKVGDVVRRGGNLYLALQDSLNQDPDIPNDGSSTNEEYWDLVIPGVRWRGVWESTVTYSTGDTVSWGANSYRCIDSHVASATNRPDDDANGFYWELIVKGNDYARLKEPGDLKTFGPTSDSTLDTKRVTVGAQGQVLKVGDVGEVEWNHMWQSSNLFYVSLNGVDAPTRGTTPQDPWRTLRYALDNITGPATVLVKVGVYEEVLPMRVPAFVAVVGEELRSTIIKPVENLLSDSYLNLLAAGILYIHGLVPYIIREQEIGTTDEMSPAFGTQLYGELPQDFAGTAATNTEVLLAQALLEQLEGRISSGTEVSVTGSNNITVDATRIAARAQLIANKEFLKNETTLYLEQVYTDSTTADVPERLQIDLDRVIDAIVYDMYRAGNWKTYEAATYFINANSGDINKAENMFLLRDGTGLRNMSLIGLEGELGPVNLYLTQRPSAGAYASLDPGYGPGDSSAWVGSKSPYVQNVTTFGSGCIGLKVDGDLHGGGNQTIVANDFTQILSDGIGVWCNGTGRSEVVSIFTYYNHIGYLCTNGGKIRGTNGNCSYGKYGAVSEGFSIAETPITGYVSNRYYDADVYQALCNDSQGIMKLFYSNAGTEYTSGTYSVTGSGASVNLLMDEFRDGGVYEVRIANAGDSSTEGGSGYVFTTNVSQGGTNKTILLAGSDENTPEIYRQMRIVIPSGTGVGQYGYVAEYDDSTKTVIVGKESEPQVTVGGTASSGNLLTVTSTAHLNINDPIVFTGTKFGNIQDNTIYYVRTIPSATTLTVSASAGPGVVFNLINGTGTMVLHTVGWDHIVEGTPILALLDTTTNYSIEPRVTFTAPGFSAGSTTLPSSLQWTSIAGNGVRWVAVASGSSVMAYTDNGNSWTLGALPASASWKQVKWVGELFIAIASDGVAAKSANGISWSAMTMPAAAAWTDVTYGNGTWVVTASGENYVATSTDAITWTTANIFGIRTATVNGNAKLTVSTQQFGSASLTLDGTGDNLEWPADPDFNLGTGDFTIEGFIRRVGGGIEQHIVDMRTAATQVSPNIRLDTSNRLIYFVNGSIVIQGTTTVPSTTWVHYALSRSAGVTKLYLGGSQEGSNYTDANDYGTKPLKIGSDYANANGFNGQFDEFRVKKGSGIYTAGSITVPTGAFAYDDATTVLLLHFDGSDNSTTILNNSDDWTAVEYGRGKFVAVASNRSFASSSNGTTWTGSSTTTGMTKLTYGNNRFVGIQSGSGATVSAITFDATNWSYGTVPAGNWQAVTYGQGTFMAVADGSSTGLTSIDGITWDSQTIGSSTTWADIAFSNAVKPGKFIAIAGRTTTSTVGSLISTGTTTKARAVVVSGRISAINLWEPGSGYTSAPIMTITDPNNSSEVTTIIRFGNGVIANPTIVNAGVGYTTTSTGVTLTGNGYKDQYQLGSFLVCTNVTRLPGPGDNLTINGINDYVYKVLSHEVLAGNIGDYTLRLNIAKDLQREETPEHSTGIEIRQLYSQVRLTGHDFLDIGLGNFIQTNYPDTLDPQGTVISPENEVLERGGGRVFYTSTDQDGNFRVGELFAVEQATGTVTLNAQFFELQGLEELRLGGVTVGGSGVVVREFSTDTTFTADSNNVVPTQKAIKAYIQRRVSGGGADAVTSAVVAGLVQIGPESLGTTSGDQLIFATRVNFRGGVDGTYLAQTYFMSSH